MQVPSRQRSSSVGPEPSLSGRSAPDTCLASGCLRQLDDAERAIIDAMTAARESIAQCEQALAQLAEVRLRTAEHLYRANHTPARDRDLLVLADSCNGTLPGTVVAERLTARELQILRLIADGMSNREIADTLFLSSRTVERHIANIYPKIGAHNKAEATAYAVRQHLA